MSLRAYRAVWEASRQSGSVLLVLLALADYADDHGRAYPAVSTLARRCRMTRRNLQRALARLKADGELDVLDNDGPKGVNVFSIRLAPLTTASPPMTPASPPCTPDVAVTPDAHVTVTPLSPTHDRRTWRRVPKSIPRPPEVMELLIADRRGHRAVPAAGWRNAEEHQWSRDLGRGLRGG